MEHVLELHPWDIAEDGLEQTLAEIASLGVTRLSLTACWPGEAVLRPRASAQRIYFPERGAVYFRPDGSRWKEGALRPNPAELVQLGDYFETLPIRAQREGLGVEARIVYLPYVPPKAAEPESTSSLAVRPLRAERLYVTNAFGDRLPGYLCPAREETRRYLIDLVTDVARQGVQGVALERYGFPLFDFSRLPGSEVLASAPAAQFLMGVCFCEACTARGEAMNIDISPLSWRVRNFLERVLSGAGGEVPPLTESPDGLAQIDELLPAYLRARNDIVGTLVRDLRAELAPEVALAAFPGSRSPASQSWREGGEIARLSSGADVIRIEGACADAGALAEDLAGARERAAGRAELSLRLRPGPPEDTGPDDFLEKVSVARGLGLESTVYAGLGELPHEQLRWIPSAMQEG